MTGATGGRGSIAARSASIAVANLEALVDQMDYLNALGCALLGSAVATIVAADGDETVSMIFSYARAQAFLLFLDYVGVMVNYMELDEVAWLTAEGLELRNDEILPDDSAGEYLEFMLRAMFDAARMVEEMDINGFGDDVSTTIANP